MSTFILKTKIGDNWITLPSSIVGGDSAGVYVSMMEKFSGLVFNKIPAGMYNMPSILANLPFGGQASMDFTMATTLSIVPPLRLCVGFVMLEHNNQVFNNGEFQINTTIEHAGQKYGEFEFTFTLENGKVRNYVWSNSDSTTNPLKLRAMNCSSEMNCVPVIFAIEDSEEFNNSYIIDAEHNNFLQSNGIPAQWVLPVNHTIDITKVKIEFYVNQKDAHEFNIPSGVAFKKGTSITLPSYETVYNNSLQPFGWRIENADYPLGSVYTVPDHNITAELLYMNNKISGMVIL